MLFFFHLLTFAQNTKILTGTVTDVFGDPVIGANVTEKGTTNGTITDLNGNFTLSVSPNSTLVVSYIGYHTLDVPIGNEIVFNIELKEDTQKLEEVVVVGYGTQKKVNLTGSVSSVSAEDLTNKPVSMTSQAIAGLAPGLSVLQTSGRPGTEASVKIRLNINKNLKPQEGYN
mgnify:CR=1 FL=1